MSSADLCYKDNMVIEHLLFMQSDCFLTDTPHESIPRSKKFNSHGQLQYSSWRLCIAQICEQKNVVHMYLPPYSPNFNPIKNAFAVIKSNLKRTEPLTNSPEDSEVIQDKASNIFTPDLMEAFFCDCSY